jgi:hypothetical protein
MPELPIVGPSYTLRSTNWSAQRTVNMYAQLDETQQSKSIAALIGTPGLRLFGTLPGQGGIRGNGLYRTSTGRCFAVQGAGFYEVYSDGTSTLLGTLLTNSGPVCLKDNTFQLVVVDGLYGYSLDLSTNQFQRITSEAFYGADRVDFLDTYLIFNKPNTNQFYFTNLAEVTFDALDFFSVIGAPDLLRSLIVTHREIWLFGMRSTEVWVDTGDALTPFARIQGVFLDAGIGAVHSLAKFGETHAWMGFDEDGDVTVYMAQGYQPVRISTHAVEQAFGSYSRLDDALGWGEEREGHSWYVLTFPTANATWVYDLSTKLWHERAYLDPTTGTLGRHRANAETVAFGKHLQGDYANGNIYEASLDVYTDNGSPIKRLRTTHYTYSKNALEWVLYDRLQLDMETGIGLEAVDPGTGQALDPSINPTLLLRWSNDGGHTWSDAREASAGHVGEYRQRVQWRRLGRARSRVWELSTTAPCKQVWMTAYLDAETAAA